MRQCLVGHHAVQERVVVFCPWWIEGTRRFGFYETFEIMTFVTLWKVIAVGIQNVRKPLFDVSIQIFHRYGIPLNWIDINLSFHCFIFYWILVLNFLAVIEVGIFFQCQINLKRVLGAFSTKCEKENGISFTHFVFIKFY